MTQPAPGITLAAFGLSLLGWGGLAALVLTTDPRTGPLPIWAFFTLWPMALTGLALPFVRYLNRRFGDSTVTGGVVVRQAFWVGVFGTACAWLLRAGLFGSGPVLLMALGLAGIEAFLRLRERAQASTGGLP